MAGAAKVRSLVKPSSKASVGRGLKTRLDVSVDGSCSWEDSSCRGPSAKRYGLQTVKRRQLGAKPAKAVAECVVVSLMPLPMEIPAPVMEPRRCAWITPYSEQVYVSFHDEEWGVPVYDDRKLFELLVLSVALAELTWPSILSNRDKFRKIFSDFELSSVAEFTDKELLALKISSCALVSEQRLRAVIENARQMLKVIEEFGSFSHYCWSFVNHKPIVNGFRYARQVPVKTPKAETISRDMMRRGFRCIGPTVVYSFMQAAGLVNDHLSSCSRFQCCISSSHTKDSIPKNEKIEDDNPEIKV